MTNPTKPEPSAQDMPAMSQFVSKADYDAAVAQRAQDGMRAAFEHCERASELTRNPEGSPDDYANPCVQSAWQGWQDCAQWQATRQAAPSEIEIALHYPACWDTAAYPTVHDALDAVRHDFQCTNDDCTKQAAPSDLQAKIMALTIEAPKHCNALESQAYIAASLSMRHAAAELVSGAAPVPAAPEDTVDAQRYRFLCRKVAIAGGKFHILNFAPTYCAPRADVELDKVIDASILVEKESQ